MPDLSTDIRYIKGIGEKRAAALARLGIATLGDLLNYFPVKYEDRTLVRPLEEVLPEETACIHAMVATEPVLNRIRRGLDLVKFRIVDGSGSAEVTFFNQSYVKNQITRGESYVFYGRVGGSLLKKTLTNPVFEPEERAGTTTGRIFPIYRLTRGISNRTILSAVEAGLDECGDLLPEYLPEEICRKYALPQVGFAFRNVHFPPDQTILAMARRRLIFEELFTLSCAMTMLRGRREKAAGRRLDVPPVEEFASLLPFALTGAQRTAMEDAARDMASGKCMNRLVQGDVGSGKTMVAAFCLWAAWKNGCQGAFMAPTEILASQHQTTLEKLLAPAGIRVGILKGSMKASEKRETKEKILRGEIDVVIGTHALLTGDVSFRDLGVVVTDEQHRFGVEQRSALTEKGERPHLLVMSATPIPRTLALMIYGDLDVSVIGELPPGRQKVETVSVTESYRKRLNGFIRSQVQEGRQVFVVCPKVEEGDEDTGLHSAREHAAYLQKELPELTVGCVHGRMKPKEKDAAMGGFVRGETDVLVSTTVVEVGVDVPNASLMIVENADRFGLSQLHQLRGRVGRGVHKSWCVLMASEKVSEDARERLRVLVQTSDGFKVAEEDLKLRGPGDFFGSRQHGLPEMHIGDLYGSMDMLREAQTAAEELMASDPELTKPTHLLLREKILRLFQLKESTWN